jgi:integrase
MLGRQAKIVSPATLRRMLAYARQTRQPRRDTVIVLLSVKAGLRACEIAGLQWSMVMTDNGKLGDVIDIRDTIAKRGSGRRIPMHPNLQRALAALWRVRTSDRYIAASNRGGPMRANSIVNWFVVMFHRTRHRRLLVPFRTPDLHHDRHQERASRRRQPTRRSAARWPPINRDHAALHRRRHSQPTPAREPAVIPPSIPCRTSSKAAP